MTTLRKLGSYTLVLCGLLMAAPPAFADTLVKVECQGNCANVTLGQACSSTGFPQAISCDSTAKPATGHRACGSGATCIPFGDFFASDKVGDYCVDGGLYDAIITCF